MASEANRAISVTKENKTFILVKLQTLAVIYEEYTSLLIGYNTESKYRLPMEDN